MDEIKNFSEDQIREKRIEVDALIQVFDRQKEFGTHTEGNKDDHLYWLASHEVFINLKNAKMWMGVMLEARGTPFSAELADKANI